ncbi:MFS transporter [Methylobacterium terricola]|uniref:MFS transporter n=1 Tax=Methylobacterium terricola TaxID=2583531 RepID=A0A5C4LNB2_9HYPH|nr:MFS transporter [Methylobacterium terricola]TNC16311.1 MFS transporter [Methylobacterium terricola]
MTLLRSPTARAAAALSLTQIIGWGATFWLPAVTGPAMAADLGLALPLVMAGPTIMLVVMAMGSWPLGTIFERCGARPVMILGSLLGAAGLVALSVAEGLPLYIVSWIVIGLAGAGMLTTPAQVAVAEIAGEESRQALGVLVLAGGLTSAIVWPVSGVLEAQWGWRATTLAYGLLMLLVCVPLHWAILARRPRMRAGPEASAPVAIDRGCFILLALSFAANGLFTWGFALTFIILFEAAGLDHAEALTAASFIGLAQWAGRLIDVLGGRRWSGFALGLTAYALFPVSFVVLLLIRGLPGTMLFATLYGVASGINAITRATLPLQIFPVGAYARAASRLTVPLNLSFAVAPPIFAALVTRAGPHAALWLALAISLVALGLFSSLRLLHGRGEHGLSARG